MKKSKKLLLVLCAVLLVVASVLGTMAYLTDTDEVTNTFTVGKVDIKLDEAKTDDMGVADEEADRVQANSYKLLPGHEYAKDPTVTVLEGSEKCYVKMTVSINNAAALDRIIPEAALTSIFGGYQSSKWIDKGSVKEGDAHIYEFWYYQTVDASEADKVLEPLFTTITVPGTVTGEQLATLEDFQIVVNAYAIQADGFATADAAWEA